MVDLLRGIIHFRIGRRVEGRGMSEEGQNKKSNLKNQKHREKM
jgi:hypothetical protein